MAKKRKLEESLEDPVERGGHGLPDCPSLETHTGRRKKSTSSRIGRACDRCQHRKLACDADPAGCQPCQKVDSWCTVTDPLTNTPTYRGEFEYLERRVAKQNEDIQGLLARLRELGQDVSSFRGDDGEDKEEDRRYHAWARLKASGDTKPWDRDDRLVNGSRHLGSQLSQNATSNNAGGDDSTFSMAGTKHNQELAGDAKIAIPIPTAIPGRKYAGLSNNDLDTRPSTKLNLLGWELDIDAFIDDADDDFETLPSSNTPLYDRSYRSFIATAYNQQPRIESVAKPTREEAFEYARVYLETQGAFTPILHKPTILNLLAKFYDDSSFRPSAAEDVCLHMLFATTLDQLARRNSPDGKVPPEYTTHSHQHYHYSVALYPNLMIGNTLQDMQALAMICIHTRHFPRPEVGWFVMSGTFNRLIQLNYHRAATPEEPWVGRKSFLEIEIRKRVFWTVLTVLITASGKLGRPMPIRYEDFDVEIPRPVADEMLLETGLEDSDTGSCYFLVALEAFKVEPIFIELYNSLYAARRTPEDYEEFVSKAEDRIQRWTEKWHPQFHSPTSDNPFTQFYIKYLTSWSLEYRLLLYHPSLSLAKSADSNNAKMRKCLAVAQEWLQLVKVIQRFNGLDTTWYNCALYMLAIQTTLYGHFQLKDELTPEIMNQLRRDMDSWLSIMGDVGNLLGSGTRLRNELDKEIKLRLGQLQKCIVKIEPESPRQKPTIAIKSMPDASTVERRASQVDDAGYGTFARTQQGPGSYVAQSRYDSETDDQSLHGYLPVEHYSYAGSGRNQFAAPMSNPYASSSALGPMSHQLLHGGPTPGYMPSQDGPDNSGMYMQNGVGFPSTSIYGADSSSWYQYAQMIPPNVEISDYRPAANTLLQLGGRSGDEMTGGESNMNGNFDAPPGPAGVQIWPLVFPQPQLNGS